MHGYRALKHDRPVGMSVGQIPWSSIIKWCELYQIHDINDIETVIRYFRAMEYAEHEHDDKE